MIVRPMQQTDRPFVACTWARGSRYGLKTREAFQFVNGLLDTAKVVVLANGRTVHAWAAGHSSDVLHYVYVPPELRGNGLARQVITELLGSYPDRIYVTHDWPRESSRFRYLPHLISKVAA